MTPLDALADALLRAADHNPAAEAPPEAVVWCDERAEFASLLPSLRARLPQLLTYGPHDPETRTGPAVWLRAAVGGALPDLTLASGEVPIVYLPGVGRETLKAAEDCPALLKPLVWWTVAGSLFGHVNGKDWTLRAFLAAERGPLRLDIPDEPASRAALAHAAPRLFATPLDQLHGRRLDADALHELLVPDLPADMLDWLEGRLDAADAGRFAAFAGKARRQLKLDPAAASRLDGAVRLAARDGKWREVWSRFAASGGGSHPEVVRLLDTLEPPADLFADASAYPRANRRAEEQLRQELLRLGEMAATKAEERILKLEEKHGERRATVWAKRGEAPLAMALEPLARIVEATALPPHDAQQLGTEYAERGWEADAAALDALAAAPRAVDRQAVTAALRAIYLPWLMRGAEALQALAEAGKVPFTVPGGNAEGDAIVFVDGLRMDLARRLVSVLADEGAQASLTWVWSGFPTVTATCKPLVSPAAAGLRGAPVAGELYPLNADGKPARKPLLDKAIEAAGWATATTLLPSSRLWSETGTFDAQGHAAGAGMAGQVMVEVQNVADRVLLLARAGRKVRIVTDHGWLLMPGGLPVAPLEPGLVEPQGKRSRCALVKNAAQTSYLQRPWTWNPDVYIAVPTGARAFLAGQEYAHGGISPQECVLPVIEVAPLGAAREVRIVSAEWQQLRLRVEVEGGTDLRVDLRSGGSGGESLLKRPKDVGENSKASFPVLDEHEGKPATLVVLDDANAIVASRALVVGQAEA